MAGQEQVQKLPPFLKGHLFPCTFCDFTFENKTTLQEHINILHKDKDQFCCNLCDFKCARAEQLKCHAFIHMENIVFSCTLCNSPHSSIYQLKQHLKSHVTEQVSTKFLCSFCGKGFKRKLARKKHILKHNGLFKCVCTVCEFSTNMLQEVVKQNHSFFCRLCQLSLYSLSDYDSHLNSVHNIHLEDCSDTVFLSHYNTIHQKNTSDETVRIVNKRKKVFLCSRCGACISSSASFKVHRCKSNEKNVFKCEFCWRSFKRKTLLKSHELVHLNKKQFRCSLCSYECHGQQYLNRHMLTHSGEKSHLCATCGLTFMSAGALRGHMGIHTVRKPISCQICSFQTSDPRALTRHTAKHIDAIYSCKECSYTTVRQADLENHQKNSHKCWQDFQDFMCKACNLLLLSKKEYQVHMLSHFTTVRQNYKCQLCDYTSIVQKSYIEHMKTHAVDKPFTCTICDYSSNRRLNLKMHLKRQHKINLVGFATYSCKLCSFSCERVQDYSKHMRFCHSVSEPFKCPVCLYSSRQSNLLKIHMETHKPHKYLCSLCKFKSKRKTLLNQHMRKKHSNGLIEEANTKMYRCTKCDFESRHFASLRNHMPIHSGIVYPCEECSYTTFSQRNLDSHKRKHWREKPFKCPFCDYSSVRKNNYKIHMVRHIKEKLYFCEDCDFFSKCNSEFAIHSAQVHEKHLIESQVKENVVRITSHVDNTLKESSDLGGTQMSAALQDTVSSQSLATLENETVIPHNQRCETSVAQIQFSEPAPLVSSSQGFGQVSTAEYSCIHISHTPNECEEISDVEPSRESLDTKFPTSLSKVSQTQTIDAFHKDEFSLTGRGSKTDSFSTLNYRKRALEHNSESQPLICSPVKTISKTVETHTRTRTLSHHEENVYVSYHVLQDGTVQQPVGEVSDLTSQAEVRQTDGLLSSVFQEQFNSSKLPFVPTDRFTSISSQHSLPTAGLPHVSCSLQLVSTFPRCYSRSAGNDVQLKQTITNASSNSKSSSTAKLSQDVTHVPMISSGYTCERCKMEFEDFTEFQDHSRLSQCQTCEVHSEPHEPEETDVLVVPTDNSCSVIDSAVSVDEPAICTATYSYVCARCRFSCNRPSVFKRHMLSEHQVEKAFACSLCPYSAKREEDLKVHMITHDNSLVHFCNLCDYKCKRAPALRKHVNKKHTDVTLFSCNLCDFGCNYESDLKSHKLKVHEKSQLLSCKLCQFSCEYAVSFKEHMKVVHLVENAFSCPHCSYSSPSWNNYRAHQVKHLSSRKFSCQVCSSSFKRSSALKSHMRLHSAERSLSCSKCHYQSSSLENMKMHKQSHNKKKWFLCKFCPCSYNNSSSLNKHVSLVHKHSEKYKCQQCPYFTSVLSLLKRHQKVHNVQNQLHCSMCQFVCNHVEVLLNHQLLHSSNISVSSSQTVTSQDDILQSNMNKDELLSNEGRTGNLLFVRNKNPNSNKYFCCAVCPFTCLRPHELKIHTYGHTGEKPFSCNLCNFSCSKPLTLKYHKRKEHKVVVGAKKTSSEMCKTVQALLSCPLCPYVSSKHRYLKYHILRKHENENSKSITNEVRGINVTPDRSLNPIFSDKSSATDSCDNVLKQRMSESKDNRKSRTFSCSKCQYSTLRKRNLLTHMKRHREKYFLCHLCDYTCREERELNRHLITHESKKPLSCTLCNYTCIQAASLKVHMMKHSGEKPFKCSRCDFRCRQRSTLRDHMMRHSSERPFACGQCDYRAKRAASLKMHLLSHWEEKPVSCSLCAFTCKHVNALRSHMKSHANDVVSS
ncbi:zinc finger protein 91 [Aplysia californica]|uniref:Zinc finger protein 91 n=1 Tax=Aplysia californica TaxID=6500 RepID=A0ABM0JGL1_APLCA|nr:zinc finger protein 91 [Aplysia californica]XP_012935122.1 zinc finger protein 91 [Aplysia californica]